MEKTVKEWYNLLPEPIRSRALKNMLPNRETSICKSMHHAIYWEMGSWTESPEGAEYWYDVYNHYTSGYPLLPLPTDTVEPKPILTQSQVEDMLLEMGQRIQAMAAKIDILIARTEPKKIDPNQIDNLHQMD